MITYIYTLSDPRTQEIRYVGKSITPKERLQSHISEGRARRYNNHKCNWIYSLLLDGVEPIMNTVDETTNNWEELERYYIKYYKELGCSLVNSTEGGDNPPSFKGKKLTQEHKEKLKNGSLLFFKSLTNGLSDTWKQNISKAHKDNKFIPFWATEATMKPVLQYTLDGIFVQEWSSASEAARGVGLKRPVGILFVCRNERFKAGGYRWVFNGQDLPEFKCGKSKPVTQHSMSGELIKVWPSAKIAAASLKIHYTTIVNVLNGNGKSAGGYKWFKYTQ